MLAQDLLRKESVICKMSVWEDEEDGEGVGLGKAGPLQSKVGKSSLTFTRLITRPHGLGLQVPLTLIDPSYSFQEKINNVLVEVMAKSFLSKFSSIY